MNHKNEKLLGDGAFGAVYQSIFNGQDVAIKKPHSVQFAIEIFQNEIAIHRELEHPNIVAYLGELTDSEGLILELIPDLDLYFMIAANSIPLKTQYSIALDIARGLDYLHTKHIIHRDLKAENVLIAQRNNLIVAKISDFGFAAILDDRAFNKLVGSTDYLAPELFSKQPRPYSKSSDIYAFSIILWVMLARSNIFRGDRNDTRTVRERVVNGEREKFPSATPIDYQHIVSDCWKQDPIDRPKILEVVNRLESLSSEFVQLETLPESATDANEIDEYEDLLESIKKLESYGTILCANHREMEGQATIKLATELRSVIEQLKAGHLTKSEASPAISKLLQNGKKIMGQDRKWQDYIAHFILACTGIGLVIMCVNYHYHGQFFLNQTTRQKKLEAVTLASDRLALLQLTPNA